MPKWHTERQEGATYALPDGTIPKAPSLQNLPSWGVSDGILVNRAMFGAKDGRKRMTARGLNPVK